MRRIVGLVVVLVVLAWGQVVVAATITFEGSAVGPGSFIVPVTPYVEAGFTLDNLLDSGGTSDGIFDSLSPFPVNTNGTDSFLWCGVCATPLQITQVGLSPFSVQSIDLTNYKLGFFTAGLAINAVGNLNGGGTVLQTFNLVQDTWITFNFSAGFTNLDSLDLAITGGDVAIDNIVLVPEPTTLLLLGTGLAMVGVRYRRRRKQ